MYNLLDHIRLVEISAYVAMPLAGLTLAGFGAHITKVVPLEGPPDQTRWPIGPDGESLFWREMNKGKTIVRADLRSQAGQATLIEALTSSDRVILVNTALPAAVSPEALMTRFTDLISVELVGRFDGASAVDYTVQPLTGIPEITGPKEHAGSINAVVPTWDIAAGYLSATAVMAAMEYRRRTGKGARIRISLYALAMATLSNLGYLGDFQLNGVTRPRLGNGLYGAFAQDFATKDGQRVMVLAISGRQWAALLKATSTVGEIAELERRLGVDFSDEGQRYLNSGTICDVLAPWFSALSLEDIATALKPTPVAWAPFLSPTQAMTSFLADPSSAALLEKLAPRSGYSVGLPVIIEDEPRLPSRFARDHDEPTRG